MNNPYEELLTKEVDDLRAELNSQDALISELNSCIRKMGEKIRILEEDIYNLEVEAAGEDW